jgi:hypothetical protein
MLAAAQTLRPIWRIDSGEFDPRACAFIDAVSGGFRLGDELAMTDDAGNDFP